MTSPTPSPYPTARPGVLFVIEWHPEPWIGQHTDAGYTGPVPGAILHEIDGQHVLRVSPEPPGEMVEVYRGPDQSRYRWTPAEPEPEPEPDPDECYPPDACDLYKPCDVHCLNCERRYADHTERDRIGCQADLWGVDSLTDRQQTIYHLGYEPAPIE